MATEPAAPNAEKLIDGLVDRVPAIESLAPDDALLERLTDDLARKIYDYPTIARRYGMDLAQLAELCRIPALARMVKAKRAVWESDASAADRVRQHWAIGMEHATPSLVNMMLDPTVSNPVKVEIAKMGMKVTGIDASREAAAGPAASQFAVNIMFSGGQVERITTGVATAPVLEGEPA